MLVGGDSATSQGEGGREVGLVEIAATGLRVWMRMLKGLFAARYFRV